MEFKIQCGVCGEWMHMQTMVSRTGSIEIVATCPSCKKMDMEIGDLEDKIFELEKELGHA